MASQSAMAMESEIENYIMNMLSDTFCHILRDILNCLPNTSKIRQTIISYLEEKYLTTYGYSTSYLSEQM